ncbi:lipoprotein, putative [Elusimicrobium minutum Pei191]|uniref:Type IV secretion system putative lipoprotein virB7 n=1 Tax=Elusimicrobium minutum (strain Pei191) TaxID=445932 RepID=B2KCT3_ELUMP|nr:PEGA domain-containing protein [Elusimicrobium minutum]ACC98329.1 lipoprotein, putative [Elusimicrobium minutum Pei191]
MKKIISFLLCAALLTGCSAFGGSKQKLTVMTNVSEAEIYINGEKKGTGTTTVKVKRNQDVQIMAKKEGYKTDYRHIGTTLSTLGVLDLIGGCLILIPFIGLAFPGAHELNQSNIALDLEKEGISEATS